jgi:ABC-type multidrug transport system ATPase subunit
LLGLKRCRGAKIKKISGGQHKRVSIAQELLSNPDILVLDEPTSGLDSLTCFKTISMLRDLVELSANNDFMKPMAIIVTIHQPQPKVFNLFHHVYILANGGRVIYEGAPENSLDVIMDVTCLKPMDSSANLAAGALDPASFLIEIASEEYGLDVIRQLSDYQRKTFYETNVIREAKRERYKAAMRGKCPSLRSKISSESFKSSLNNNNNNNNNIDNENNNNIGPVGKDNHGFCPDSEHKIKTKDLSISIVAIHHKGTPTLTTTTTKQEPPIFEPAKLKISCEDSNLDDGAKCKRRKRTAYSPAAAAAAALDDLEAGGGQQRQQQQRQQKQEKEKTSHMNGNMGGQSQDLNLYLSEQLLYTREPNHKGRFWSHTATLTHRTLLTIRRDPLLMTSRVLFHLMIPILMGHVYGKATGAANACPHYEPEIDITQIPNLVENKRIEFMLEELHMSIENVSMFFIIMYAFAAAVLALNALSFPLNMQVLLKETRNGWYSMSSYVLAKTLADLPLELTMPCMTMLLVYPLTGQPSSYLQWRMLTICLIMTLCSLIAQTQALILGALVMNSVQTAVFVSQASQLPWVILAGFTIRIKRLSEPLKLISLTSFYRLGCEAITLTRYGFGICPCNPQEITGQPVKLVGIPDQLRTVAQYWLDSIEASKANNDTYLEDDDGTLATTTTAAPATTTEMALMLANSSSTTLAPSSQQHHPKTDIFQHLANQLSYANSYGVNITSCDDVAPDRIRAINLGDNWLVARIWHLIIMLLIMKVLLYYAVKFSIGIRL